MTPQTEGPIATCDTPIDPAVLADYWLALLSVPEEQLVEEHLLTCDSCGDRLQEVIQLSEALRAIARTGALRIVVADEFISHAAESGQQVRQYDVAPGQTVACTISAADDLLVARLAADLSSVDRVDLRFFDLQGVERHRMTDIPVRHDAGRVIFQESTMFAKAAPSSTMVARLLAVTPDGGERLLAEYRFEHTRTMPGPPGWSW